MIPMTDQLIAQFRQKDEDRTQALTEVLCSAYKDAIGAYPDDRVREAIYEAVKR